MFMDDNGDIYYYNLQDNIDTSAITGYDMYAVRDFDASYPIAVAENDEIVFDLDGYTVNFGDKEFSTHEKLVWERSGVKTTEFTPVYAN